MVKTVVCVFVVWCLALSSNLLADVKPAGLFSDNAVLQQGISVPVWGTAGDGEHVTVSFQDQTVATVAKDGKWMVRLAPLKAGGPFALTITGNNTVEIRNVLVGEVWVAGGQSNMQFTVDWSGVEAASDVKVASSDPMLRLLSVPWLSSTRPAPDVNARWAEAGPDTVGGFSAVAYFFGRDLRKALGVPVGMVNASVGATFVEAWTASKYIYNGAAMRRRARTQANWQYDPNRPAALYNGMIAPLIPYAIRGAIWYQGESNTTNAYAYRTLFPAMIRSWRENWGQGDFPFLFVQIAPWGPIATEPEESNYAEVREAQLLTAQTCPNTAMAVVTDYGDSADEHPKQKEPVSARLILAARALAYGQKVVFSGPVYKSMKVKGNKAVVSFDSIGGGLVAKGDKLTGWTIAGRDRKFRNAEARIAGKCVEVWSLEVSEPEAVRYGWAKYPVVNLFNRAGLPASPFRTDGFPGLTSPE